MALSSKFRLLVFVLVNGIASACSDDRYQGPIPPAADSERREERRRREEEMAEFDLDYWETYESEHPKAVGYALAMFGSWANKSDRDAILHLKRNGEWRLEGDPRLPLIKHGKWNVYTYADRPKEVGWVLWVGRPPFILEVIGLRETQYFEVQANPRKKDLQLRLIKHLLPSNKRLPKEPWMTFVSTS